LVLHHPRAQQRRFERVQPNSPDADWTATALTADDILELPEIGIEVPLVEFYQDVDLRRSDEQSGA
jgi:hypothetical protein